jgi:hypothetical protein
MAAKTLGKGQNSNSMSNESGLRKSWQLVSLSMGKE